MILPNHSSNMYGTNLMQLEKGAMSHEATSTSGLERVNTLTTRLHRLPTVAEEKSAYDARDAS